jgi:hypothetical protein
MGVLVLFAIGCRMTRRRPATTNGKERVQQLVQLRWKMRSRRIVTRELSVFSLSSQSLTRKHVCTRTKTCARTVGIQLLRLVGVRWWYVNGHTILDGTARDA